MTRKPALKLPPKADQIKVRKLLEDVMPTIDDLVLSGLASASKSSHEALGQAFRQASQLRLLRLGSTLRIAAEEIARYAANAPTFSRRRYSFFINRAWMLCRGMTHALEEKDAKQWTSLTWQSGGQQIESMTVVALGVSKRVVPETFCGFEFRLRRIDDGSDAALTWSTVFPMKKGIDVPAEAYLRLPQKQKFKAAEFLERSEMLIRNCQLSSDGRIQLTDESTVEQQSAFEDWGRLATWDPAAALQRLHDHEVNPFDLDVELQQEVVLQDWKLLGETTDDREQRVCTKLESEKITFEVFSSVDSEGKAFRSRLKKWAKRSFPIYGILHYEQGGLVLQPLSIMEIDGPAWLSLDEKDVDYRTLIKALNF